MQEAVNDFLDHGMKRKSPQTVANYRSIADHHLIPFIGAANLKMLTADELDIWQNTRPWSWCSAARTARRWTAGRSAASSPPSPRPQAWARSGHHGS